MVQQVARGFGFEAWKQLCKEFEPHPPVKPQGMRQALLSSTKSAEPVQTVHHQGNGPQVCEEATECLRTSRMCEASGCTDLTELVPLGEEQDDEPARLKEHFGWWEAGHNDNECRNFSAGPEKKCDQHRAGQCADVKEDPESSKTGVSGQRGTSVLSPAAEQDACLLHEEDGDQSMYSCPPPASDRSGKDLENLAVVLSPQVWFDTEALEPMRVTTWMQVPRPSSIRKQRSDQMFKSSRQKRSQQSPNPSRVLAFRRLRGSLP